MNFSIGTVTGLILAAGASAQSLEISSYTIDGGGGTSAGGVYSLSGTIGQPDAGGPMTGGVFELAGGFWSGVGQMSCTIADLAEPFGQLDLADITVFVSTFLAGCP